MDEETRKIIEEMRKKYKDNKEVQFLFSELASLELKLISADVMALTIDVLIQRGMLGERSLVADARIDYGTPWEYEFADKDLLLRYRGGIDGVKERLSKPKK